MEADDHSGDAPAESGPSGAPADAGASAPPSAEPSPVAAEGSAPPAPPAPPAASTEVSPPAAEEITTAVLVPSAPAVPVTPPPELSARPLRQHAAPVVVALDQVTNDATFRLRGEGEIAQLATDLARLGQLFPVDLRPVGPDRYQVVCGFRRIGGLRFLQRDKVVARVHADLSDSDALLMALAAAIHAAPVPREELAEVRTRLEGEGRLEPAARDMLEKALASEDGLAPESLEEEVDADELAIDATLRLGDLNQDLSLLADVFGSLDDGRKEELLRQLRYSAQLVEFLEGK